MRNVRPRADHRRHIKRLSRIYNNGTMYEERDMLGFYKKLCVLRRDELDAEDWRSGGVRELLRGG